MCNNRLLWSFWNPSLPGTAATRDSCPQSRPEPRRSMVLEHSRVTQSSSRNLAARASEPIESIPDHVDVASCLAGHDATYSQEW